MDKATTYHLWGIKGLKSASLILVGEGYKVQGSDVGSTSFSPSKRLEAAVHLMMEFSADNIQPA